MPNGLQGKVAVITGSSRGIGWAIAQELGSRGCRVAINARDGKRLDAQVGELQARGYTVMGIAADVSRSGEVAFLAESVIDRWGEIDIWINNAGDTVVADSMDLDPLDFARIVELNLNGVFYGSQAAARQMASQGAGVIVQMGSIFGSVAAPRRAAYVSSKHALVGLTKVLADEWARFGIRVVCIEPGYINTDLALPNPGTGDDYSVRDIEVRTPMGRYGTPSEVAKVVAFLVSDDASYMTGSVVSVDGGWLAHGGWRSEGGQQ